MLGTCTGGEKYPAYIKYPPRFIEGDRREKHGHKTA